MLALTHEHSRPDVNKVLDVFLDNVDPSMKSNFDVFKYGEEDENLGVHDFDTPYDLSSIMQYPSNAFSIDKNNDSIKTMKAKDPHYKDSFGYSEMLREVAFIMWFALLKIMSISGKNISRLPT